MTRGYDDTGRLNSVQDWLSNTTTFGYDVNSNLTTETLPSASGIVDTFTFDAADRLTAISDKKGKTTLFAATYTRDNANQLSSDSSISSSSGSYKYNSLNQLCYAGSSTSNACTSPPRNAISYKYDAADNLIQKGGTQQAFNNADELCWTASTSGTCASPPTGATTYTYDTRGNRTKVTPPSGGATTLGYDQADRLTAYGMTATYAYNGDGLRMSKTVSGSTSQFLWDIGSATSLLLKDGSTAYVYGPAGLPLEQINGSSVLWLHHDQLGSTRLVTNNSGASQATYTFDAYDNLTASTGTLTNPMRFAGQYQDSESTLYYLRARYYDSTTGQFVSRDPVVALTRGPYGYVGDNPLNQTDNSGMCFPVCVLVGAAIGAVAGLVTYGISTAVQGKKPTWQGAAVAIGSGALAGAVAPLVAVAAGGGLLGATVAGTVSGFVGGASGSALSQGLSGGKIDISRVVTSGMVGGVFGAIGGRLFATAFPGAADGVFSQYLSIPSDSVIGAMAGVLSDQVDSELSNGPSNPVAYRCKS